MSHRRSLPITFNPLKLSISIALGLWLGFLAIALTCWLLSKFVFNEQLAPLAEAARHISHPPPVAQPAPQTPMFDQYEKNLLRNEQQQRLENARTNGRNLANPKCQFWLQQDQTAPSDKSRAQVLQLCE